MAERIQLADDLVIWQGHVIDALRQMPDQAVHTCITSDPYYGLRDYGQATWHGGDPNCKHDQPAWADDPGDLTGMGEGGQLNANAAKWHKRTGGMCPLCGALRGNSMDVDWPEVTYTPMTGAAPITVPAWRGPYGLEPTVEMYVAHAVLIRRELWRVLRDDGTHWINLGDSYSGSGVNDGTKSPGLSRSARRGSPQERPTDTKRWSCPVKQKDLIGIPWRVAFALQADGWTLRSAPPWIKRNSMPESVPDRPSTAHENWFLLTKSNRPEFWTHPRKRGVRKQPKPDQVWQHKKTGLTVDYPPVSDRLQRRFWSRQNLWEGHDYFYDTDAVRKPATLQSSAALSFARSGKHSSHILPGQNSPQHRPDREAPKQDALGKRQYTGFNERWNAARRAGTVPPAFRDDPTKGQPSGVAGIHPAGRNRRTSDWWTESLDELISDTTAYLSHLLEVRENGGLILDVEGGPLGFMINPQPYKEAHFATFPPRLVEPPILAGTSPKACPHCGAPWVRVVVTERENASNQAKAGGVPEGKGAGGTQARGDDHDIRMGPTVKVQTIGWAPTCTCKQNDGTAKCRVLDIFWGSGTLGQVALQLGREAWGCELNPKYVEMSRRRIEHKQVQFALSQAGFDTA